METTSGIWRIFILTLILKAVGSDKCHLGNTMHRQENLYECSGENYTVELKTNQSINQTINQSLIVRCKVGTFAYADFTEIDVESAIISVELYNCQLPECQPAADNSTACSLHSIAAAVGARSIANLTVSRARNMLHKEHFFGLNNLMSLTLKQVNNVSSSAFTDLTALNIVIIQKSNITLNTNTFRASTNLTMLEYTSSNLSNLSPAVFMQLINLRRLFLYKNKLQDISQIVPGLTNLQKLDLSENDVRYLEPYVLSNYTPALTVFKLFKHRLGKVPDNVFSSLHYLETIDLKCARREKPLNLGDNAFANLSSLQKIDLRGCNITKLPKNVFLGTDQLTHLTLTMNNLSTIPPETLANKTELLELNLNVNRLETIDRDTFQSLHKLQKLFLANNSLRHLSNDVFRQLRSLREIKLSNNVLTNLSADMFRSCVQLVSVDLVHNHLASPHSLTALHGLPALLRLNMSHNIITDILDAELELLPPWTTVDLQSNNITRVTVHNATYYQYSSGPPPAPELSERLPEADVGKLLLEGNPLRCDCHAASLARAAREPNSRVVGATCDHGTMQTVTLDELQCRLRACPRSCECAVWRRDRSLVLQCRVAPGAAEYGAASMELGHDLADVAVTSVIVTLTQRPTADVSLSAAVTHLAMSRLNLTDEELADALRHARLTSLQQVNVSHNRLRRVPRDLLQRGGMRVLLTGNDVECDCDTFTTMRHFGDRVSGVDCDFKRMVCVYRWSLELVVACCTMGVAVFSLLVLAGWWRARRSRREGRGCAVQYDVFVAHAAKHSEMVARTVLPALGGARVCAAVREWRPGGSAAGEAGRSVRAARGTLLVTSLATWSQPTLLASLHHATLCRIPLLVLWLDAGLPPPAYRALPTHRLLLYDKLTPHHVHQELRDWVQHVLDTRVT